MLEKNERNLDKKRDLQAIRLERFIKSNDLSNIRVENRPVCIIADGTWDYPLFTVNFFDNMVGCLIYCLAEGYAPSIKYCNSKNVSLWDQLLIQPYGNDIIQEPVRVCDEPSPAFHFPIFPSENDIKFYGKIFKLFFALNKRTRQYFVKEEKLIKDKRVVGVLCRGTDYTSNKPKRHPVQPRVSDVVGEVRKKMEEYRCDYIYLPTEEARTEQIFEEAFPGKIITNVRQYYDSYYDLLEQDGENTRISWVHFDRDNDDYLKSLEYMSSINLLSKCNIFIGGNCGGSRAALYLNCGQYEYNNMFNLGVY